jgi:hypothetical protein
MVRYERIYALVHAHRETERTAHLIPRGSVRLTTAGLTVALGGDLVELAEYRSAAAGEDEQW